MDYFLSDYTEGQLIYSNFHWSANSLLLNDLRTNYIHVPQAFPSVIYITLALLFPAAVREMGSDFVLGYIQAMDGEKDPRNIVIAFNSVRRIVIHLSFGEHSGKEHWYPTCDMAEDLKTLLHVCINCVCLFLQRCWLRIFLMWHHVIFQLILLL